LVVSVAAVPVVAARVAVGERYTMNKMTPEDLVRQLREALPADLRVVVLYGSAAAGDYIDNRSDTNVLVVVERLDVKTLRALAKPSAAWVKAGSHAPLLFTPESLRDSAEVFPIETLDIKDVHKVLFGDDPFPNIEIGMANLRLQVEHELRGKLMQLRSDGVLAIEDSKRLVSLMIASLSKFLILFRAALRLHEQEIPSKKLDALHALARHLKFDPQPFVQIQELKEGRRKAGEVDAEQLFERYLQGIEQVVRVVDQAQPRV
jgi:predicted nucleotidyltransferase